MMHFMRLRHFLLFGFLFLLFQIAAQPTTPVFFNEEMLVTASSLNLRESPDVKSKKVTSLTKGTVVKVLSAYNNGEYMQVDSTTWGTWYQVQHKDKIGYAFGNYLADTYGLYHEGDFLDVLPPVQWYGVYARDSFADEIRKIDVRIVEEESEMYGTMKVLKTNQKAASKFIIGSLQPVKTGYAGSLGIMDVRDFYMSGQLAPGAAVSIHPGGEMFDTTIKPSYTLMALGCAVLTEDASYVRVDNYQLLLFDYTTQPPVRQDMTDWVRPGSVEFTPAVSVTWYGDLDGDNKPDAVLGDCPYESGCRESVFLSSKARRGEFLRKVCERFWPGD